MVTSICTGSSEDIPKQTWHSVSHKSMKEAVCTKKLIGIGNLLATRCRFGPHSMSVATHDM